MRAKHITSDPAYRQPFGAAQLGGEVTLAIDVWDEQHPSAKVRLWVDDDGETLLDMQGERVDDHTHFSVSFKPSKTEIIWYSFQITADDGAVWRYGARPECTVGEGAFAYGDPPSFQITVFEPRETKPDWYRNGIVYQIFPDRFFRGKDWERRVRDALEGERKGPERDLIADWNTTPHYRKDNYGRISVWDFYGGTLEGIREKLDYLEGLGITVIYLNPIFEAASNHRYDTADYEKIDPMLGDEESFKRLCADAKSRGISIILDGVFNHTGCDSRYFNKYGNYPTLGAYQSDKSPYASWYKFSDEDRNNYQSWWGVDDLPDVEEEDPGYREFICGENGIVRKWLRLGASGWRLDVADELPDDFIEDIKSAALAEKPDAVVIGEVWEDASNKRSYGVLRKYLQGKELDGTMNYPFRTDMLDFLNCRITAQQFADRLNVLQENYPADAFYSELNLLGSHDRERLLTMLGNCPAKETLSDDQMYRYRMTKDQRGLAVSRLWVAALLQMTMPGVPCVYYGDEAGVEGYTDPYNRSPYPWGNEDANCRDIYRNAIAVRRSLPVFTDGDFKPFSLGEHVFGFTRSDGESTVCVLANASLTESATVKVPMADEQVDDIVQGTVPEVSGNECSVFLWPLGTSVLYFHKRQRLQRPMERGMGVLCHITSLPNDAESDAAGKAKVAVAEGDVEVEGARGAEVAQDEPLAEPARRPGTMGAPAKAFVDYLADCGQSYWQVLPVNPTDNLGSPYAGLSAFAGNPFLIEGIQTRLDQLLDEIDPLAYAKFCSQNEEWLRPYATFRAIKEIEGDNVGWQQWPAKYRDYKASLSKLPELRDSYELHCKIQFIFEKQWNELRRYANARGIKIIGDIPMYVSLDSADVWSERKVFNLDPEGMPAGMAGAPPDGFAADGQLWGNPTYRWDYLKSTGYDWWMRRLERMLHLYDYVRLDHFLGFSSYYVIPKGKTAREGAWHFGPGLDLFRVAHRRFGDLPFIGEDLGVVTPAVRMLVASTGFPGMDVIQFYNGDVRQGYVPAPGKICYTSTHDTQTLMGWVKSRFESDDPEHLYFDLMSKCLHSAADVVMVPLQDVLSLDDSARMNLPGVAEGNWTWQAQRGNVEASRTFLAELARSSDRELVWDAPVPGGDGPDDPAASGATAGAAAAAGPAGASASDGASC